MEEFEEIAHSGGKIKFLSDPEKGTAIQFSQSNPWALTLVQVCVSLKGEILDFVPSGGISSIIPYPQPSILAFVISDRQGLFGRQCPKCNTYFRSNFFGYVAYCPYCRYRNKGIAFLTKNQIEFIRLFCNAFIEAHSDRKDVTIDLDDITKKLSSNKPRWVYSEEKQQNQYECKHCRVIYDVLGDYSICPSCAGPNFSKVINSKLDHMEQHFRDVNEKVLDRHEREVEWEKLTRCVSEFEALANTIRSHLLLLPATPKRKADISTLSFQNIIKAHDCIVQWFGIDIFKDISDGDREFLNKMFNRRHVFVHNAGKIDQEYINNTGDTSVRLNQVIRFSSREIKRLLPLVQQCSINFIEGFESIK